MGKDTQDVETAQLIDSLREEIKRMAAVVETATACFDRQRPGVWFPAFIEMLQARVNEYLDARTALAAYRQEKP